MDTPQLSLKTRIYKQCKTQGNYNQLRSIFNQLVKTGSVSMAAKAPCRIPKLLNGVSQKCWPRKEIKGTTGIPGIPATLSIFENETCKITFQYFLNCQQFNFTVPSVHDTYKDGRLDIYRHVSTVQHKCGNSLSMSFVLYDTVHC
jgi:hypothetical protein